MRLYQLSAVILMLTSNSMANAGEAHICASKILPLEQQEQMSDDTIFKCEGIKNGKNTFTINELAQSGWQIVSVQESVSVYKTSLIKTEIYHQIVMQKQ